MVSYRPCPSAPPRCKFDGVNRDNELVGMVTFDDLVALLDDELRNLSRAVTPVLNQKAF